MIDLGDKVIVKLQGVVTGTRFNANKERMLEIEFAGIRGSVDIPMNLVVKAGE